mmetsp:Transcript_37822/g.55706  ORF Transcript_37822/g.55706 Transcript_37822/m.55706 type:complete len:103 (-) Transcript_37822:17-325(-)|eukprot:CAMPEP_0195530268 /NCGR_PEP_ID=MMETSP0794_2-20130614/33110_1 /TAXON_ID=515487 /ORGANISM="Stephanopyxis turris, Strain CCMP 815" /LENGTH=102 /DNA_ID=CAMNT_0040661743 /DNA_START=516 /DNA_END=824 /DNA_ORIENTATION=-
MTTFMDLAADSTNSSTVSGSGVGLSHPIICVDRSANWKATSPSQSQYMTLMFGLCGVFFTKEAGKIKNYGSDERNKEAKMSGRKFAVCFGEGDERRRDLSPQ